MSEEKKKIIIDEDWKTQVEAEKEAFAREKEKQKSEPAEEQAGPFPTASFEMLVTTFTTQAMVALGQIPNPVNNQVSFDSQHARYAIYMLEVLEEKTKGNLTQDEANMLENVLHQLRMAFVATSTNSPGGNNPGGTS